MTGVVVPLVLEPDGDVVVRKSPEFLDEAIVLLSLPLASEEGLDLFPAVDKLGAVTPLAIDRVRQGNAIGVAAVPRVFRRSDLSERRLSRKRGDYGRGVRSEKCGHGRTPEVRVVVQMSLVAFATRGVCGWKRGCRPQSVARSDETDKAHRSYPW